MKEGTSARTLDHLVLAVTDLDKARSRLETLGFNVALDALHPFGTANACVYFTDGTYLEPLAVANEERSAETAREGNVFTARDGAFRFRHGSEGLTAVVFKTDDADSDDIAFRKAGFSAGAMLEFSRPLKLPDGRESTASFKLAFAADLRSPDIFGFTCQRINVPAMDRPELVTQENGVIGISGVVLSENDPAAFQDFLRVLCGAKDFSVSPGEMMAKTGNGVISVLNREIFEKRFQQRFCSHARGLRGRAVIFRVKSMSELTALFDRNHVGYTKADRYIVVSQEAGQGILFAFEEEHD